jgi:hypothetical protein
MALEAAKRIKELEALLQEKDQECVEAKLARHLELQESQFRDRLQAAAARRSDRSVSMEDWTCDELAGWFQEIQLAEYCHFILLQKLVLR